MAIVIEGILRRSRGNRAYLVYRDAGGLTQVVRLRPVPELRSGETITVIGRLVGRHLEAHRVHRRVFPRHRAA